LGPFEVENCRIGGLTDVVPLGMWREEAVLRLAAGLAAS
jgi:hypothetical protein